MARRWLIIAMVLAGASLLPLLVTGRRLAGARGELSSLEASLARVAADGRTVLELRGKEQRVAEQRRPENDLIERLEAAFAEADVRLSLEQQRQVGDEALGQGAGSGAGAGAGGVAYRRQTIELRFSPMTLPELGRFLAVWSSTQALWTPTEIALTSPHQQGEPPRFGVTMQISATYIGD